MSCELTILMPCLNESETLATCITKAKGYLEWAGIEGEVLIADNGSTDGSQEIAKSLGARVVDVQEKGYGAALLGGMLLLGENIQSWEMLMTVMISQIYKVF